MTTIPTSARLRPAKMSEVVARAILEYILENDLQPGDALPNEKDALQWLGVSRGSLREGLRLLEAQGVIMVRSGPGGGPVVRRAEPESLASAATLLMQFMRVPFGEVLEARIAFEPQVAQAAAANRTDQQLSELVACAARMSGVPTFLDFKPAYDAFHRMLAEAVGNRAMMLTGVTFRKVWDPIHTDVRYTPHALARTAGAHRRLADAVEQQDPDAARIASSRHLIEYRAFLLEHQPALLKRRVEWSTRSER